MSLKKYHIEKSKNNTNEYMSNIYKELGVSCQPVAINSGKTWPKKGNLKANKIITVSILKSIKYGMDENDFVKKLEKEIYSELKIIN